MSEERREDAREKEADETRRMEDAIREGASPLEKTGAHTADRMRLTQRKMLERRGMEEEEDQFCRIANAARDGKMSPHMEKAPFPGV